MTKIFLLGTFHFNQDSADFFTEDSQRQLRILNENLMKFVPDAVCVETPTQAQSILDAAYTALPIEIFNDYEFMRSNIVGKAFLFGQERVLSYQNETVQIGIRLAKSLGLDKIHAVDEVLDLPGFEMPDELKPIFEQHMGWMNNDEIPPMSTHGSLYDRILFHNLDEWSYRNHQLYIEPNIVGAGTTHEGADYLGDWYKRNLRIFANLQKLCKSHKRIFSVYGAGHLCILRELINACEYMELVDWKGYLG